MISITNLIIIDASFSMNVKQSFVKEGIVSLMNGIKKQKDEYGEDVTINTIITDFSGQNDMRTLLNTSDTSKFTKEIAEKYTLRGMTALYDAIFYSFNLVPEDQDGVFVNIITDGEENNSVNYDKASVKELIASKHDWNINFMGTTQQAIEEAEDIGIRNTMSYMDSGEGTRSAFAINNKMSYNYSRSIVQEKNKKK